MNSIYVYIAGPYTKGDVAVNVRTHLAMADHLAILGYIPYVPLLTHFWHLVFPHPYEFWCKLDLEWIPKCDILLRMPGDSSGADKEVEYAKSQDIPVVYSVNELRDWTDAQRDKV